MERLARAWHAFWPNWFHVQNYFGKSPLYHSWSLAVEEHFYLALPVILVVLLKLDRRGKDARFSFIPWLFGLLLVGCLLGRIEGLSAGRYPGWSIFKPTHLRADALMGGVALAWLVAKRRDFVDRLRPAAPLLIVFALAAFLPSALWEHSLENHIHTWGFTANIAGAMALTLGAWLLSRDASNPSRLARAFAYVGTISYSVYLWHVPFGHVAGRAALMPTRLAPASHYGFPLVMLLYVIASLVIGAVMYHLVEAPILAWRDRNLFREPKFTTESAGSIGPAGFSPRLYI